MDIQTIGNGISMREVTLEDAGKIYDAIDSHREYLQIWLPFAVALKSVKDEEDFLNSVLSVPHEMRDLVYIIEEGDQICGLTGFCFSDRNNHRTEIGYWLLPEFQHRGIMTACVRMLCRQAVESGQVNRIQIRCAAANGPSNAVARRLGFVFEGTERQGQLLASGVYTDIHVYSLLKSEIMGWK